MDETVGLLQSLAIDRAGPKPPARYRVLLPWAIGAASTLGAFAAASYLAAQPPGAGPSGLALPGNVASAPEAPLRSAVPLQRQAAGLVASGYVVARRKATVAAQITGKVVELLVEEGDVVQIGGLLARLDSTLAETDLALARSRVLAADAGATAIHSDLRDAERILARTQALSEKGFATEADLTKLDAKAAVLRAHLNQANAQLETARLDVRRGAEVLEQHSIRAPFTGVVIERSAQPGEMISLNSAGGGSTRTGICTMVDMDSIEIEVDVNEAYIGRANKGGTVSAVLDAYPDWRIPASVIAVVPTANRDKATVKVRIGLKQKDPRILPDMAVKVSFLDDVAASDPDTASIRIH
jgi:HlyD family secretion protein